MHPNASNVTFPEIPGEQEHVDAADNYQLTQYKSGEQLGLFFTRPVHLYDISWNSSTTNIYLKPWLQWYLNPRVQNRLANYAGFKGRLHLKFTVIGNPFFFGRMQIAYHPLANRLESILDTDYGASSFGLAVIRSQRLVTNIDPSISSGSEMVLPFVWDQDYMKLDGSTTSELDDFGALDLDVISSLQNVNLALGATPPEVTLRLYGWMDDFETFGNTAFTGTITPQCDSEVKENWEQEQANKGKVSDTLSSVARTVDLLATVPAFTPYATPAAVVTHTAASIAQKLGFSKPLSMDTPSKMIPRPFSGETHVIGADTSIKLTLTPHQTTTIDPVVVGGTEDEMSFKYICGRKSLFQSFPWNLSDPAEHLIASYPVTPHVVYADGNLNYYATAIGGVSNLFGYWFGTLEYTFELISTCFHRGRIIVVYDPVGAKGSGFNEENVQYAAVVDISEARSFTVSIGFNSTFGMLPIGSLNTTNTGTITPGVAASHANGTISLYVANPLTVPNYVSGTSPESIDILSYVKGGDDLSFAFPRALNNNDGNNIHFESQSDMSAMADMQLMKCCDKDGDYKALDVAYKDPSDYGVVYKGEDIQSLRTLIKRFVHYYSASVSPASASELVQVTHGPYPAIGGEFISGSETGLGGDPTHNYTGFIPMSYIRMAFMTVRGSARWKFVPLSRPDLSSRPNIGMLYVIRSGTDGPALHATSYIPFTSTPSGSGTIANVLSGAQTGMAMTSLSVNDTLEFEMPYQAIRKFRMGRSNDSATIALTETQQLFSLVALATNFPSFYSLFVAAGEDYTVQHFVGWPPYKTTTF